MSVPLVAPSAPQATDDSNFGGPNAVQMAAASAATGVQPVPNIPPVTPAQPAKEPTVVSSSNITDNVIPNMTKSADALAQKGTYVDTTGAMRYSDGSLVPAPIDAEFDAATNTWKSGSSSFGAAPQFVDNPDNDPDVAQTNSLFASMKANLDSTTLTQVNAIQQQYDSLRSQQQSANAAADAVRARYNLTSGATRFAPLDAAGVALAQTSYGLQQIAKLDADENSAIANVKAAQQSGNFQLMEKALGIVEDTRTAKQAAAQKVADQLSAANDALLAHRQTLAQDNAIADLYSKGVTAPADVLKAMNAAGYEVTADDVAKSLKDLQTSTSSTSAYKFSNTDVGSLLGAGIPMASIQGIEDYYNGTGNASALNNLTSAQQAAVQTALVGKGASSTGSKVSTSGTLSYTQSDLDDGNAKLEASKGTDGYVDPNLYLNMAQAWTGHGGSIKDFLKHYPVSSWVNPANTFVVPTINGLVRQDAGATKTTAAASDLSSQINDIFGGTSETTPQT